MAEPPFRPSYPGYDVLAKWDSPSWNEATRRVVHARLTQLPPRRFFSEGEWTLLAAICDRLLPQPEREHPIPIVPWIDARLFEDRGSGTRYADMPPAREMWRRTLAAIDDEAGVKGGFLALDDAGRDRVLTNVQNGRVRSRRWKGLAAPKAFVVVLGDVVDVYYSHPAAWSEAGYGGPASPRGYARLDPGRLDPWEAK